jgi:hypothetical protein
MFLKNVERNKKMKEILFEHLKDKPNNFEKSMKRIKRKIHLKIKELSIIIIKILIKI